MLRYLREKVSTPIVSVGNLSFVHIKLWISHSFCYLVRPILLCLFIFSKLLFPKWNSERHCRLPFSSNGTMSPVIELYRVQTCTKCVSNGHHRTNSRRRIILNHNGDKSNFWSKPNVLFVGVQCKRTQHRMQNVNEQISHGTEPFRTQ